MGVSTKNLLQKQNKPSHMS